MITIGMSCLALISLAISSTRMGVVPAFSARRLAFWMVGSVSDWVREGQAQLEDVYAASDECISDCWRLLGCGVACSYVADEAAVSLLLLLLE